MKTFLTSIFFIISVIAFGQPVHDNIDLRPLLYKQFIPAKVIMKSGDVMEANFNYNTDKQALIFVSGGQFMELSGLDDIKEIQLDKSIFVPINGKVYERTSKPGLFASYSNKVVAKGIAADKSGTYTTNKAEVSNDVSGAYLGRNYKNRDGLNFIKDFWVLDGGRLVNLQQYKQLAKILNVAKSEINDYVSTAKPNFNSERDMIALLEHFKK